jgi:hypothetical protein
VAAAQPSERRAEEGPGARTLLLMMRAHICMFILSAVFLDDVTGSIVCKHVLV